MIDHPPLTAPQAQHLAQQDHAQQDAAVDRMRAMLAPTDTATQLRAALNAPYAYPLPIPDAVQGRIAKAMAAEGIGRNALRSTAGGSCRAADNGRQCVRHRDAIA